MLCWHNDNRSVAIPKQAENFALLHSVSCYLQRVFHKNGGVHIKSFWSIA